LLDLWHVWTLSSWRSAHLSAWPLLLFTTDSKHVRQRPTLASECLHTIPQSFSICILHFCMDRVAIAQLIFQVTGTSRIANILSSCSSHLTTTFDCASTLPMMTRYLHLLRSNFWSHSSRMISSIKSVIPPNYVSAEFFCHSSEVRARCYSMIFFHNTLPSISTKSRKSDFSVSRGTNSN